MLVGPAKSPLKSLGVLGAAGAIAVSTLGALGVPVAPVTSGLGGSVDSALTLVFALVALYGRLTATTRLTTAPAAPADAPSVLLPATTETFDLGERLSALEALIGAHDSQIRAVEASAANTAAVLTAQPEAQPVPVG